MPSVSASRALETPPAFGSSPPYFGPNYYAAGLSSLNSAMSGLSLGGGLPPTPTRTEPPPVAAQSSFLNNSQFQALPSHNHNQMMYFSGFSQTPPQGGLGSSPNFFSNTMSGLAPGGPAALQSTGLGLTAFSQTGYGPPRNSMFNQAPSMISSPFMNQPPPPQQRRIMQNQMGIPRGGGAGGPVDLERSNRSHLLDDFRNNRNPHLQLTDLQGHVVEFAQDQYGSRLVLSFFSLFRVFTITLQVHSTKAGAGLGQGEADGLRRGHRPRSVANDRCLRQLRHPGKSLSPLRVPEILRVRHRGAEGAAGTGDSWQCDESGAANVRLPCDSEGVGVD